MPRVRAGISTRGHRTESCCGEVVSRATGRRRSRERMRDLYPPRSEGPTPPGLPQVDERGQRSPMRQQKGCGTCHRIHNAGKTEKMDDRCVSCHQKAKILGTAHAGRNGGACRRCHPAHDNPATPALKKRSWEETFVPDLACLRCHREEGPGKVPGWTEHPKIFQKVPPSYGATLIL